MKFTRYVIKQVILYIIIILILGFLILFDKDIHFTLSSFITLTLFITVAFLVFIIYEYFQHRLRMQDEQELIRLIHTNQMPSKKFEDELLRALVSKNIQSQESLYELNENQIKWIHDIKMPLATLQLFIRNNYPMLTHDQRNLLELVSLDFDYLINNKLMADKTLAQVDDLFIEQFDIQPIITTVIKKYAPLFQTKKIKLIFDVPLHTIIRSDVKSVQYIMSQLIHNALKYTKPGGNINISCERQEEQIKIIVKDDGEGIDAQDIPQLFEYGYTGINGKNQKQNAASGIGLYMVKQSIDKLQHAITVSSDKVTGTTFTLFF